MKIICVGRNYVDHAKEMNSPVPKSPLLFMKPSTALMINNKDFWYPDFSEEIHHEIEIVLRINKHGRSIQKEFAHKYYNAITVGIDFTARDIQRKCKEKGHPWEKAKAFDNSAPIGRWIPIEEIADVSKLDFSMNKNGEEVQASNTQHLIFPFDELISYTSSFFTLNKGDLIFTGTPAGVGPIAKGDLLTGYLNGEKLLTCNIK